MAASGSHQRLARGQLSPTEGEMPSTWPKKGSLNTFQSKQPADPSKTFRSQASGLDHEDLLTDETWEDVDDVAYGLDTIKLKPDRSQGSSEHTIQPGDTRSSAPTPLGRTGDRIWYAPRESITDARLLEKGYGARARVIGSREKGTEQLDPRYKTQSNPTAFFRVGRVIKVLWSEPIGFSGDSLTVVTMEQKFAGEKVAVKIRWFVVIMEGDRWCTCLPISTYGGHGVSRQGLHKWQHSVIYSGRNQPSLLPGEEPVAGEHTLRLPIRVKARDRQSIMERSSRLHYAKMYTIEHNVKVFDFGMVVDEHIPVMVAQWREVMEGTHATADESQSSHGGAANLQGGLQDGPNGPDADEDGDEYGDEDEDEDEDEPPPAYINFAIAQRTYRPKAKNMQIGHMSITQNDRLGIIEGYTSGWYRALNLSTWESGLVWKEHILLDSDHHAYV